LERNERSDWSASEIGCALKVGEKKMINVIINAMSVPLASTVGRVNVHVTGTLTKIQGSDGNCSWSFSGAGVPQRDMFDFNQSPNRFPEEGEEEVGFDWGIATFATLQWLTSKPFAIVFEGDIELKCGGPCPRGATK
jgi:hypothetical protein